MVCALVASPWLADALRAAEAGDYPNRPMRCILPSTVGGSSDMLARLIGARLSDALGQPFVIEARPGAAGRIAVEYVARAAPDGYTLLLANNAANAIVPAGRGMDVDEVGKLFVPVTLLTRLPIVIVVTSALGVNTLPELIARARAAPGRLSFASSGPGSTSHTAAVVLFQRAGVRLLSVPYAGTAAAIKDVLAGEVPVLFTHLGTVAGLVQTGQLKALAVTGSRRMADFPGVETVAEAGYPGFDITTWHGVVAPAATPRPIVVRLSTELMRIVALPEVRRQIAAMGMEPLGGTPEQFASVLDADVRRWAEVIRAEGIRTQ